MWHKLIISYIANISSESRLSWVYFEKKCQWKGLSFKAEPSKWMCTLVFFLPIIDNHFHATKKHKITSWWDSKNRFSEYQSHSNYTFYNLTFLCNLEWLNLLLIEIKKLRRNSRYVKCKLLLKFCYINSRKHENMSWRWRPPSYAFKP